MLLPRKTQSGSAPCRTGEVPGGAIGAVDAPGLPLRRGHVPSLVRGGRPRSAARNDGDGIPVPRRPAAGRQEDQTAWRRAFAITHTHRAAGLGSPVNQEIYDLLNCAQRLRHEKPRQMRPLTIVQLRALSAELRRQGTAAAVRNRAILVLAFATALRRSSIADARAGGRRIHGRRPGGHGGGREAGSGGARPADRRSAGQAPGHRRDRVPERLARSCAAAIPGRSSGA